MTLPRERSAASGRRRVRVRVTGTVQGVGFRPYVFRLATAIGLGGYVLNDERGVLLEVEGASAEVDEFLSRLPSEAPPLAKVEDVAAADAAAVGEQEFRIVESEQGGAPEALVSADAATCSECLAELLDPTNRRHRYPFTNCTNCGPRFTIVRGVPYDRSLTTMDSFEMCPQCRAEYEDPGDRRFHAQPNACPNCGPIVRFTDSRNRDLPISGFADPIEAAAEHLIGGRILAVKGLGGFHLACRADSEEAVESLRSRKHREERPFALMAPDLETAGELLELTAAEEELLEGRERPIVIARRRQRAEVAGAVAPRSRDLGVMLPYTPLHHLLLRGTGASLVMTSGNVSDEPIAFRDSDGLERLGAIADAFLIGDRPIHVRTDDSVVRSLDPALGSRPLLLRRSRGYVPQSLALAPPSARPLLACGAEQKNAFCLAKGGRAWVSHHIGDLKNLETLESFAEGIEHFQRLFAVEPELVVHDLHPDYLSTRYALEREGVEHLAVQHHHAHFAACLAEHGEEGPAVGAIYDGTGYGPDGTVWGGELLCGGLVSYRRVGLLFPVRLPGGEAAIREPWRMACAWIAAAREEERPEIPAALAGSVEPKAWEVVSELARSGVGSPLSSSVGRLFDAIAALCGIGARVSYEGQAAAELEGVSDPLERRAYPLPLIEAREAGGQETDGALLLDARVAVRAVLEDLERGVGAEQIGGRFHESLARATAEACRREAEAAGTEAVVLSGGVFQNRLLLERTAGLLKEAGLRALLPRQLPPNDGGIAYGQAAVAAQAATASSC